MSWLDNLDVIFENKELTLMRVDAMVCPISVNLKPYGKISQKLYALGQSALEKDLTEVKASLSNEKLNLGQAISIDCKPGYTIGKFKKLIFVALWDIQSEYNLNLFYKAYINSIRMALQDKLKSIALPIMAYDGNLRICGQAIEKVINELNSLKGSSDFSIEEIYFVSTKSNDIEYLRKEVEPKIY